MAERTGVVLGLVLVAAFLAGCGGDGSTLGADGTPLNGSPDNGGNGNGEAVTLAQLSTDIFTPRCATTGCHSGAGASGSMSLAADRIEVEAIDVSSVQQPDLKRIDPGDPEGSYLLRKVRGDAGISFSQMPPSGGTLTAAQIEQIRAWIEDGAPTD